jgi:hypothetical protein
VFALFLNLFWASPPNAKHYKNLFLT